MFLLPKRRGIKSADVNNYSLLMFHSSLLQLLEEFGLVCYKIIKMQALGLQYELYRIIIYYS